MLGTSMLEFLKNLCEKLLLFYTVYSWTKEDKVVVSLSLASDLKKEAGNWIFQGFTNFRIFKVAVPT